MVTLEQVRDDAFCEKLENEMGKKISAIGCAGRDLRRQTHYPRDIQVIDCPVYHNGDFVEGPRDKGLRALQTACSQAVEGGTAVLIHCNRSFHRGPILAVACMISGGHYTNKHKAFELISERRKIYPGHTLERKHWPDCERNHVHASKLLNAHDWLQKLCKAMHGALREGNEIDEEEAEGRPPRGPMIKKLRVGDDWKPETASPKSMPKPDRSRGQAESSSCLQPVSKEEEEEERLAASRLAASKEEERLAARSSCEEAKRTPRTPGTYSAGSSRGSKNELRAASHEEKSAASHEEKSGRQAATPPPNSNLKKKEVSDADQNKLLAQSAAAFPPAHGASSVEGGHGENEQTAIAPQILTCRTQQAEKDKQEAKWDKDNVSQKCEEFLEMERKAQEAGRMKARSASRGMKRCAHDEPSNSTVRPRSEDRHAVTLRTRRKRRGECAIARQQEAENEGDFGGSEEQDEGDNSEPDWSDEEDEKKWNAMSMDEKWQEWYKAERGHKRRWVQLKREEALQDDREQLTQRQRHLGPKLQKFLNDSGFDNIRSVDETGSNVLHALCKAQRKGDLIDLIQEAAKLVPKECLSAIAIGGQLSGFAPLHILCGAKDRHTSVQHLAVRSLVVANADINQLDRYGRTPLLCCAGCAWFDGARELEKMGADLLLTMPGGRNFADLASSCNQKLSDWWEEKTRRRKTGIRAPPKVTKRVMNDKRKARQDEHQQQRAQQPATQQQVQRPQQQPTSSNNQQQQWTQRQWQQPPSPPPAAATQQQVQWAQQQWEQQWQQWQAQQQLAAQGSAPE